MSHYALLKQLIEFDSAIYRARRTPGHRTLLLTSEIVGFCLLERAIAISKRNVDPMGNVCPPVPISKVGSEVILSNGSLIQYTGERPLQNLQKYDVVFWQPPTRQQLVETPSLWLALPANVLAPGGSLIRVGEEISSFYQKSS